MSEKGDKLELLVQEFIKKNEIGSGECIYQCDHVIESAYEFIEDLCDVVGYWEYPE